MSRILAFSKANPIAFGVGFSTVKTSGADLLVQMQFEKKKWEEVDWKRNSAFAMFGCFYLGGVQYLLYVPIFSRLFPNAEAFAAKSIKEKLTDPKGIAAMMGQVFLDQCVHHPLLYFPVFYSLKEVVGGGTVSDGLAKYQKNWKEDLVACWKVWVPATSFNFTFSPMYLRIPVVATTSMLWTCILSAMRGGNDVEVEAQPNAGLDVLGNQGAAFRVIEAARAAALDPSLDHLIITATGADRVGLVNSIAQAVAGSAEGAMIGESKMVKMGGQFMMMMVCSVKPDQKAALTNGLINPLGNVAPLLNVTVTDISDGARETAQQALLRRRNTQITTAVGAHFDIKGPDKPGIVAEVSGLLAKGGANVERMETRVTLGPDGKPVFHISGEVVLSGGEGQALALIRTEEALAAKHGYSCKFDLLQAPEVAK